VDFDRAGRLCSLARCETLLGRLYRGETSAEVAGFLKQSSRTPGDHEAVPCECITD
jgi:hypothetical protein